MAKILAISHIGIKKTFNCPYLDNYRPYELVFVTNPKSLLDIVTNQGIMLSGTCKDDYMILNES